MVAKARGGAAGFTAFGVDVARQQVVFQIALSVDETLIFSSEINKQLFQASQAHAGDAVLWEILGQYANPPPPPPVPGGDEKLARELVAVATKNINTQLKGLTSPATASH